MSFELGFSEGQAKFDRGEHLEAARTWIAAAANLNETAAHRDNRVAVYEYVVDAFTRGLPSDKRPEVLREAADALDAYCDGFTRAYGTETPLSPKIMMARDDFKKRLAAAEAVAEPEPPIDASSRARPGGEDDLDAGLRPWKGLAIGGGVLIGLGIGGAVVMAVGGARGTALERQFDDPARMCILSMPSVSCQDLLERGKSANTLTVAGAVIAPLLAAAGVALLAIGLRRRAQRQTVFAPAVAPGFGGVNVRGGLRDWTAASS